MQFDVEVSQNFDRQFSRLKKRYPSLTADVADLITQLRQRPIQGDALGKSCYKVRLAISAKGKGKSGGGRVITCVKVVANRVFLLAIYDKSEQENLFPNELDDLLRLAGL